MASIFMCTLFLEAQLPYPIGALVYLDAGRVRLLAPIIDRLASLLLGLNHYKQEMSLLLYISIFRYQFIHMLSIY